MGSWELGYKNFSTKLLISSPFLLGEFFSIPTLYFLPLTLSLIKKPLNQKGNRRLAVFRLGSPTGSLLTLLASYSKVIEFVTTFLRFFLYFIVPRVQIRLVGLVKAIAATLE
jgi:hypothetical protein